MPEVTLLGTGGMLPLKNRWLTSLYTEHNGKAVLIDCGEGTQIALAQHGLKLSRIDLLLITHSHADHVTGLPGLLLSLGNTDRTEPLAICCPAPAEGVIRALLKVCGTLPYPVQLMPLPDKESVTFAAEKIDPLLQISTVCLQHTVPCLGYRLDFFKKPAFKPEQAKSLEIPVQYWKTLHSGMAVILPDGRTIEPKQVTGDPRKPVRIAYSTDTLPIPEIAKFAEGVDLFVCEGMYGTPDKKQSMNEKKHMLMQDACQLAGKAGAERLWLTHYSPAEKHPEQFREELEAVFRNVTISQDGERIVL